jgi:hypothetical protein
MKRRAFGGFWLQHLDRRDFKLTLQQTCSKEVSGYRGEV